MRFWDASAVVPLLIAEPTTAAMQALAADDPAMLVWWATEVECASALARLEREGGLDASAVVPAFNRLKQLAGGWHEVDPSDAVRETAVRLLRVHSLRTADALQLAAAFARRSSRGGGGQGGIPAGRGSTGRIARREARTGALNRSA